LVEKFNPQGLSETIFRERYAIHPEESWDNAARRLGYHVAQVEEVREEWSDRFYEEIVSNRFMPGGRIWYGAGRPRAQLLNCFVIPTHDSREGWGKTIHDVIVVSGMGGGVGINCSPIRPRGSKIQGTGGVATGAVSLMQMVNAVGDVLVAGGGRRLALMLDLNITHPDMPEFLDKKLNQNELNNANISLILDKNTQNFAKMVKNGDNFPLKWQNEQKVTQNAKEVWNRLVENAWTSGEPVILNGQLANQQNNIWFHKSLVSTNPCGEIWLEEYGFCDLGALVLPRFVNSFGQFDWDSFDSSIKVAVRFLDNVLSVNEYPLPEIRDNCQDVRRIGLGIMGLHSLLIQLGYKYSSIEAQLFVEQLMDFLKKSAYAASIELAKEKGQFPVLDREAFLESGFVKESLPQWIKDGILENGIRNCALLTIAPTGTTAMVSNVSTGIEPLFSAAYWRRFYRPTADGTRALDKQLVVDPLWEQLEREGKDISVLQGAYDISPEGHFEMQKICQAHIDNATSKTINLPETYPVESLSDLWLEYLPHLKGTTLYRAGSRGEEPLEAIPLSEAQRIIQGTAHSEANVIDQNSMDCVGDNCAVPQELKPHIEEAEYDYGDKIAFV
jgi:ribonucleoside-diphosphate reductase alpha chain